MSAPTIRAAIVALRGHTEQLAAHTNATAFVHDITSAIFNALDGKPSGTMSAWFKANDGASVATVQVDINNGSRWCPTGRTVDASRATFVTLSGSRRDYSGMHVLSATDRCLIVFDDWHVIAYVVELHSR